MATILPRPDVSVTSRETDGGNEVDVVISRPQGADSAGVEHSPKARSYVGGGAGRSRDQAFGDALEKILGDHNTAEDIP